MFVCRNSCSAFRNAKNKQQSDTLKRCFAMSPNKKIEPVNLSYASYETTTSFTEGKEPPPLIVMHGLFGSKANWNSLCKAYHKKTVPQRKVFAVDARNHGDSPHSAAHSYSHMVEDFKAFCDQQRIRKAAFLGHSMGGRAVMLFALNYVSYPRIEIPDDTCLVIFLNSDQPNVIISRTFV